MRKRLRSIVVDLLVILFVASISGAASINAQSKSVSATTMEPGREKLTQNLLTVQLTDSTSKRGDVTDLRGLIRSLRAAGLVVKQDGRVSQPFFSVKGRILKVNGEDLQVFEYANTKVAEKEAEKITPTGSAVGMSMPTWIAPPHFYKSGRLIVLYVGSSSTVVKALERALGPQFAGQ